MRRSLTRISYPVIGRPATISAAFSTSSGGGRGRGSGRSSPVQFTLDNPSDSPPFNNPQSSDPIPPPQGHGRGRGQPSPSFSSSFVNPPPIGRGRGSIPHNTPSPPPPPLSRNPNLKIPNLFVKDEHELDDSNDSEPRIRPDKAVACGIIDALSGSGRGKPLKPPEPNPNTENRHIRKPPPPSRPHVGVAKSVEKGSGREEMSQEEKVKKAVSILSRGDAEGGRGRGGMTGGRGGRGGRGRGRGRGRVDGRGRGRDRVEDDEDDDDETPKGLYFDPAGEEMLAQRLGPERMSMLAEAFEEAAPNALPDPVDDAFVDALHTNLLIECEPEYLMEEFGTNPDIDEKPPIPLRDALEKMKPFLMAYEGIQSQEEWEEVIEETMKNVPLIKEIVDHYSGPDRVTAKQQNEELERVAKTLPASAPTSVKRFTERAVLSLQSNPGWGFDKKCQFMDKLVMEVSKQYK